MAINREAYLTNLSKTHRVVQSEIFDNLDYVINDEKQMIEIEAGKNGKLAVSFDVVRELIKELREVNQVLCLKGEV